MFGVWSTPFGSPVVPDVNTTSCTVFGSLPGSGLRPSRASQAVSVSRENGFIPGPGSPRATNTRSSRGVSVRSPATISV